MPLDAGNITLFGAKVLVLASYGLTNPIKQFLGAMFYDFLISPIDFIILGVIE
jgi:hypothetical protein